MLAEADAPGDGLLAVHDQPQQRALPTSVGACSIDKDVVFLDLTLAHARHVTATILQAAVSTLKSLNLQAT